MEKNFQKYHTYRNAIDQINLAIDSGFFLEAITIEESILADRLYRFCKDNGYKTKADRATLGDEKRFLEGLSTDIKDSEQIDFLTELKEFWLNRNICLHQIAKSEPGEPTIDFEELTRIAKLTAVNGKQLTKKVSNWAQRYKTKTLKVSN
jgi:hypothetical protein